MRRSLRRVWAVLAALGVLAGTGGAAAAATPPSRAAAVPTGVVFSTPSGTRAQQDAIENRLIQLVNGAARGSTIQLAIYFLRDGALVNALINAHRSRNVGVKVVVDERNTWEPPRDTPLQPGQVRVRNAGVVKLEKALGTKITARSFLRVCSPDGACIGTKGSPKNHNKFYLFSDTLGTKNVVVQGSGNISPNTRLTNFNEAVTFPGNTALYGAYQRYFNDLAAMRKNANYYRTYNAGAVKTFFYPRRGATPWEAATDDVYQILKNVKCTGNKKVGTSDHRTIVRVNMFELNRADVAHKLFDLDAKGCYVELIYSAMSRTAENILTAKAGKYHGPVLRCSKFTYPVRDDQGRPVLGSNGKPKTQGAFTHDKYLLIEGVYYGQKDKKIILAGSHNFSYSALRENDETLLRIDSPALYNAYRAGFDGVRAQMTKYHSAPIAGCHSPGEDLQARTYLPKPAEQELERELQDEYEN
ncbi:phospholipase D-like domain-containing protein [Actinoallomurus sp. NPDC052274]|uniref:phospholipase D-like domain-containing protein n=1 Tax=Actinoallomurus sp. NPDC052274 TaxID=3155420 RepID=UPI00341CBC56